MGHGNNVILGIQVQHEIFVVFNITVAVVGALLCGLVAHRLKQSPIVGYLLAGVAIGPFTPGFVGNREQIAVLAEVGVIFLMFALGIEFSLKELARSKGPAILGTIVQLLLIIGVGTLLGRVLGWSLATSVFFGGIISVSSTMVILKNLMSRGEIASNHGRLLLSMLIVQDLAVVVLILLLPRLTQDSEGAGFELVWVLVKALLFIGATLLLGIRVVPALMERVAQLRSSELFLLTAVALALGSATISALLGLSPALGAFMGGLMLTETNFDHRVTSELIPMRDLFATLFFVSIGMLVDLKFVLGHLPQVVGMAAFIMVAKSFTTLVALAPFKLGSKTIAFTSLGLVSIGEFNFVLAQNGLSSKAITTDIYNLVLSSALLTILLTPGAFYIAPRVGKTLDKVPVFKALLSPEAALNGTAEAETQALEDHAIVIGYGRVGRRMVRGLRRVGLPVVVVEQDIHLINEIKGEGISAVYGDASYETVLHAAHPEAARVIVVALPDFGATRAVIHRARAMNPTVLIVARAQRAENDARLRDEGATAIVVPELAGALALLQETLLLLDLPHEHVFSGLPRLPEIEAAAFVEPPPPAQTATEEPHAERTSLTESAPQAEDAPQVEGTPQAEAAMASQA